MRHIRRKHIGGSLEESLWLAFSFHLTYKIKSFLLDLRKGLSSSVVLKFTSHQQCVMGDVTY